MTTAQKLQLRASEIRARLSEIATMPDDGMTDEIRTETDKLTGEYRDVELRNRAAIVAEDAEREEAETRGGADGPDAETRAPDGPTGARILRPFPRRGSPRASN